MERALYVEARVGSEGDAAGIDQKEVGAGDRRAKQTVDDGCFAAGYPRNDVVDIARPGKRRALAASKVEVAEAVEEIAAELSSKVRGDQIIRPREGTLGPKGSIQGDLRLAGKRAKSIKQRADDCAAQYRRLRP